MDNLDKASRSKQMAKIPSKNTKPEMVVRRFLHKQGFRYRTNYRALPGSPDIVFTKKKKVIFVHGCFWHGHGCKLGRTPKSNISFWVNKIENNRLRDLEINRQLALMGWAVLILWECQIKKFDLIATDVVRFVNGPSQE